MGASIFFQIEFKIKKINLKKSEVKETSYKAKKKTVCLKLAAHICFLVCFWLSKIQAFNIFFLDFFPVLFCFCFVLFYELACQNIYGPTWKDMTDTIKLFWTTLCSSKKSSSIFHTEQSCDQLKFDKSAAQENKTKQIKNKNKRKTKKGNKKQNKTKQKKERKNAFRWGLPISHKLWDIEFFFVTL